MQERSNGAVAAPSPRLTAGEAGQRLGKAARTVYEIWDKGAMWSDGIRRPDGKWAKRWTFAVCVDAYLQAQAQLRQGPTPSQLVPTAPAGPEVPDVSHLDARAMVEARWPDLPEAPTARMTEMTVRYRRELAQLPPDVSRHEVIRHFEEVHRVHRRWKRVEHGVERRQDEAAQENERAGLCAWGSLSG